MNEEQAVHADGREHEGALAKAAINVVPKRAAATLSDTTASSVLTSDTGIAIDAAHGGTDRDGEGERIAVRMHGECDGGNQFASS